MIISYKHQYIFMHCRKTAGSAIAVSLARSLGPNDIFIGGIEEAMDLGIKPPRQVLWAALRQAPIEVIINRAKGRKSYTGSLSKNAKKYFGRVLGDKPQHARAAACQAAFPKEWAGFFKFCVVRNPFDLVVSDYYWRTRGLQDRPSFETYMKALDCSDSLNGIVPIGLHSNWPIYTIGDEVVVDAIYRYEQLPFALEQGLKDARVPFEGIITKSKSAHRSAHSRNFAEVHTKTTRKIVARLYEKELTAFDYRFEMQPSG